MSDETKDKVSIILSDTALQFLDLFIENDFENIQANAEGEGVPDHMRGKLSRESAVFFAILVAFLIYFRGVHPKVAAGLVRSMAGRPLEDIDATMHDIERSMGDGVGLSEQMKDAIKMRVFVVSHERRDPGDEPIH